jgi:lipoprotein-anchoring transpeptidase ErfK/SrfK
MADGGTMMHYFPGMSTTANFAPTQSPQRERGIDIAKKVYLAQCRLAGLLQAAIIALALLVALFVSAALVAPTPTVTPPASRPTGDGEIIVAVAALPQLPITATLPRPVAKPPLPFAEPQIGPLIKRAPMDDIENRTTAFLPTRTHSLPGCRRVEIPAEDRWIRVDLSEQMVIVYADGRAIRGFVISSGLPRTPTVLGEYRIRTKVRAQTMSGGSGASYYSLPNVQWVQYFYADYSFHSTYWHSDFGRPKSHGCINMTNADAKWLFDWAGPVWDGKTTWFRSSSDNLGTLVIVHA